MTHESVHITNSVVTQKPAYYAEHVLTGSNGSNALLLLDGTFEGKKAKTDTRRSMTRCNVHKTVMKLKDWQRTASLSQRCAGMTVVSIHSHFHAIIPIPIPFPFPVPHLIPIPIFPTTLFLFPPIPIPNASHNYI